MDDKKKNKTRRENYSHLGPEELSKKGTVFGKKVKEKKKKKEQNTGTLHTSSLVTNPFIDDDHRIFGVPLVKANSRMRSHDGILIPAIVRSCIDYINENGLSVEGIYRISAPKDSLDKLEEAINRRCPVVIEDVHNASGLLKRFLRQLPQHILTNEKRSVFENIASRCPCGSLSPCRCLVADMLKAELSYIPNENYMLLAYLFIHTQMILAHSSENKMGLAALGLILQATLNISQPLVRIFLLNSSDLITTNCDFSMVYLFKNVKIIRYVGPKEPKTICEENLAESEEELSTEEMKQRSRLRELHKQIEELREFNAPTKETEEELWDVQTAITMLCRKLKAVRNKKAESMDTDSNVHPIPTLEVFEEKQLIATCTALREDIARQKLEIISLDRSLNSMLSIGGRGEKYDDGIDDRGSADKERWRQRCVLEVGKRDKLIDEIVGLRNDCCELRAQLELKTAKGATLLVTRF